MSLRPGNVLTMPLIKLSGGPYDGDTFVGEADPEAGFKVVYDRGGAEASAVYVMTDDVQLTTDGEAAIALYVGDAP
jgi:hypothetical protein